MKSHCDIVVIIPVLNEEQSIGKVLLAIPSWVDRVLVIDNGSADQTKAIALAHGAVVLDGPQEGYGSACLTGIESLRATPPEVVVFLDGDYSDYPEEMSHLVDPVLEQQADFVMGSRVLGVAQKGALLPHARFGNALACTLMRWIWKYAYTDLGPFRAIRYSSLAQLQMRDRDYGWTIEMQIKAIQNQLRIREVPVSYRPRRGQSKISGTWLGSLKAGGKILYCIGALACFKRDGTR